jgi:hypothetical protein
MAVTSDRPVEVHEYHTGDSSGVTTAVIVLVLIALAIVLGFWWNRTRTTNILVPSTQQAPADTNANPQNNNGAQTNPGVSGSVQGTFQGSGSTGGTGSGGAGGTQY